jgi:hypothetical protein
MAAMLLAACTDQPEADNTGDNYAGSPADEDGGGSGDGSGSDDGAADDGGDGDGDAGDDTDMVDPGTMADAGDMYSPTLSTGCPAYNSGVYTPFENYGPVTTGKVSQYPWRGQGSTYPDTVEDFRSYSTPSTVECSASKGTRNYLDVTSGCLSAVSAEGGIAGQIHGTSSGYYRSFSLPFDSASGRKVAWTDMGVEYRFKYSQWTGDVSGPGFKIFGRYMTEYDLYVGSWRMDGVVQIQKKHCGVYTVLKRINFGAPSPNVWHTIKFETVGNQQKLYLDGQLVMTTTDDTIKRGTAGIRIDSAESSLIDDWRVYAP